jgi:metal-responsive CopG/Arc/MetJ family transcriptional regulator
MPRNAIKVAITIPADLFRAIEAARRGRSQTRSAAVQEALRQWLRAEKRAALTRQYEAGYRRRPESQREIDAALVTAVGLLHDDEEW